MKPRPPIPSKLQRAVLIEAGHRCAIHTCRQSPVEISHIVSWSKCKEHKFDNLFALCPTCHTRFDKGEIDRKSMLVYKRNLGALYRRYGDYEERILERLARNPEDDELWLLADLELLIHFLLEDGLLAATGVERTVVDADVMILVRKQFKVTLKGQRFISQWMPPERSN